jgi:cytochrome c556
MTATHCALSLSLLISALGPCSEPAASPDVSSEAPQQRSIEAPQQRSATVPQQQTPTAHTFMRDHARDADEMRRAVIAGRFDLIHRVSGVMASDAWSSNLRPDYVPHVTALRNAAAAALDARSMRAAGAALGELGAACAACHREHGGPPVPAGAEAAQPGGTGAMAVHAAAEQALWEGLFTPSEASWKRGAAHLASAPELASDIEDIAALGSQLRDLALDAAAGTARGDRYGSIVATCSSCHRRFSIEPH